MRIRLTLFLIFLSAPAFAYPQNVEVDLASCLDPKKSCFSKGQHVLWPEKTVKILAWFDIVYLGSKQTADFFPLFNVYNYGNEAIDIEIGMQLLDKNEIVLIEIGAKYVFKPTKKTKPSYETYRSLNANPVSADIILKTKFVRVEYNNRL